MIGCYDYYEVIIMSVEDNNWEDGLYCNSVMSDVKLLFFFFDEYFYGGCELMMIYFLNFKLGVWCVLYLFVCFWIYFCGIYFCGVLFIFFIKVFWMNIIYVLFVMMYSLCVSICSFIYFVYFFICCVIFSFYLFCF